MTAPPIVTRGGYEPGPHTLGFVHALRDLDGLVDMLRAAGSLHDEEDDAFTILDHGLQCAANLQRVAPDDLGLQAAGLVHDLGWLERDEDGGWRVRPDAAHDAAGAALVRPVLGERVATLVGGHVAAKRYLVATEPTYAGVLSGTSTYTLAMQGGAMSADEIDAFLARPDADALVALRRADEAAKVEGADVPGLDVWMPVLRTLAS
jgi:predicted HD phosphohydrolase